MKRIETLYLAGPDLWFPEREAHDMSRRALCESAGFRAVTAPDPDSYGEESTDLLARQVYAETAQRMRKADALIVNLSPWRGPNCDPATAYAAGFAAALSKPVFAYMNLSNEEDADHRERVERLLGATPDPSGVWRDDQGGAVEDYGLPEAMML